jgi:hypothetical protein
MLACDFFTVETLSLHRFYVLFFIELERSRVHGAVHADYDAREHVHGATLDRIHRGKRSDGENTRTGLRQYRGGFSRGRRGCNFCRLCATLRRGKLSVTHETDFGTAAVVEDSWCRDGRRVAAALGVDVWDGLGAAEAAARLKRFGRNRLEVGRQVPEWRKFLAEFKSPLIYLLLVAIVVSVVAWAIDRQEAAPYDAIVIVAIVLLNAVLGYVQEARAEQAVVALQTRLTEAVLGLEGLGIESHGMVGSDDPLQAIGDAFAGFPASEILLVAQERRSFEHDLERKARDAFGVHVSTVTLDRINPAVAAGAGIE